MYTTWEYKLHRGSTDCRFLGKHETRHAALAAVMERRAVLILEEKGVPGRHPFSYSLARPISYRMFNPSR